MTRTDDWLTRLGLSLLFGGGSTVASLIGELFLSTLPSSTPAEFVSYIIAIPLLPGLAFVSMFYNSWQAFHQGQIALVPIISFPVDVLVVFGIWTFLSRRTTSTAEKHVTLHINQ